MVARYKVSQNPEGLIYDVLNKGLHNDKLCVQLHELLRVSITHHQRIRNLSFCNGCPKLYTKKKYFECEV